MIMVTTINYRLEVKYIFISIAMPAFFFTVVNVHWILILDLCKNIWMGKG